MAYTVRKETVWYGKIKDRPGGLAEKLNVLTEAGANLEFVLARRATRGTGLMFVTPVRGSRQTKAAQAAGLSKSADLQAVRVEGPDKPGLGSRMTTVLADADINVRGLSAAVVGRKCIVHLAFDSARDAATAIRVLKRLLSVK